MILGTKPPPCISTPLHSQPVSALTFAGVSALLSAEELSLPAEEPSPLDELSSPEQPARTKTLIARAAARDSVLFSFMIYLLMKV